MIQSQCKSSSTASSKQGKIWRPLFPECFLVWGVIFGPITKRNTAKPQVSRKKEYCGRLNFVLFSSDNIPLFCIRQFYQGKGLSCYCKWLKMLLLCNQIFCEGWNSQGVTIFRDLPDLFLVLFIGFTLWQKWLWFISYGRPDVYRSELHFLAFRFLYLDDNNLFTNLLRQQLFTLSTFI